MEQRETALTVVPDQATLLIRAWPDPVIDTLGHDPRSGYVEGYWLGILGPSTTWLLRRLVAGLEESPSGFELDLADTARRLGLGGKGGRHSPFRRALSRLVQFEMAQVRPSGAMHVRRKVPPLSQRQVAHLPPSLQEDHRRLQEVEARVPAVEHLRRRGRHLALSLLELGDDLETTEHQLMRWHFHPALARESAAWAWDRHRRALAASQPA
ncbi:MAG: hypothetical protein ACRD0J_09810 [Acidimicrobiales bacterium]